MSVLVNQLVTLTRMDEDKAGIVFFDFNLRGALFDTVSEFYTLAHEKGKHLSVQIEPDAVYHGDEASVRRLISVLLDNAVKYCDPGGDIIVYFSCKKYPVIIVENSFASINHIELGKLFDRFYRSDKSRTYDGSFGIGFLLLKLLYISITAKFQLIKKMKLTLDLKLF